MPQYIQLILALACGVNAVWFFRLGCAALDAQRESRQRLERRLAGL